MGRYKEIQNQIQKNYHSLPKNLQFVAKYFIENFDNIPFLNVNQVSEATSRSVASVIRFAQRVGFSGFSELRDAIAESLKKEINKKEIFALFDSSRIKDDVLSMVANQDISNINATLSMTQRGTFNKTIELILGSKRVFVAGLGISQLLAQILAYSLNQVGIVSYSFASGLLTFLEQSLLLDEKDLLIVFSFPPYSKETILTAEFASKKNVKIVAITNKQSAPVTFHSDQSLIVKSENMLYTNSFAAISVLINAIATSCALRNETKAKNRIKQLRELRKVQDYLVE